MSNPYFSVGEEVILQSNRLPQLNGEYIVEHVFIEGDTVCKIGNTRYVQADHPSYYLEGESHDCDEGFRTPWRQSALRKKHKPSTDSFTEMMSNINEKVTQ